MTVRINKQKINLREKLAGVEEKVNFDEVVRGLGEYTGNVGIGTTNPSAKLEVSDSEDGGAVAIRIVNEYTASGSTDETSNLEFWTGTNNTPFKVAQISSYKGGDFHDANINLHGGLTFWTQSSHTQPLENGYAERMRIDSAGNVGIGITSTSGNSRLSVKSEEGYTYVAHFIASYTDPGSTDHKGIKIQAGLGNASVPGNNKWIEFFNGNGSTLIGGIRNASSSSVEFFNGSDIRIKKNINDTSIKGIDSIKALKLRSWDWNSTEPMTSVDIGLVADELEEVFPELVSRSELPGWEHCVNEGEEDLKTIPTESKITLTLIKAVQEQQQLIDDLKSRIETLEQQ